jgi:large subunit ribosomal protein L23
MNIHDVLLRPVVTEKTTYQSDSHNQYTFEVDLRANKRQVKEAVESVFDVSVLDVRVILLPAKRRRNARSRSQRAAQSVRVPTRKKAIVTLAEGQSIHFFEGV